MNDENWQILAYPFVAGHVDAPRPDSRVLCLNAAHTAALRGVLPAAVDFVQHQRTGYLELKAAGCHVHPRAQGTGYDAALIATGRHRRQNEGWIAQAVRLVKPGGLIVVGGSKTDGAASLRKRLGALVRIDAHAAKFHGMSFWFRNPEGGKARDVALALDSRDLLVEGRFHTRAGMFSSEHVDPASRILGDHLPSRMGAHVADFGAGWGYLSRTVLDRCEGVATIDLYEADFEALEAAKPNVGAPDGIAVGFHWRDLLREKTQRSYDAIVMNPPFHAGRAADTGLGAGMIEAAARALGRGGRLFMVANRQLPYEAVLARAFPAVSEIALTEGFKVIRASR